MTDDDVRRVMRDWLAARLPYTVIHAYESGPTPSEPYVMVNLTGTVEVRDHEQGFVDTPPRDEEPPPTEDTAGDPVYPDIEIAPIIEIEWRFSIHAYGGLFPMDILRPLRSAAKLNQVMEPMFPDLVIHEVSQVRDLSEYIENRWQKRAQVDIFVHGVTTDGFAVDVISGIEPYDISAKGT